MPRPWKPDFRDEAGDWSRKKYQSEYQKKNRAKAATRMRCWREANPEKSSANNLAQRKSRNERDPFHYRDSMLKRQYGIGQSDYEEMFAKQGGKCAICRTDKKLKGQKFLHVDHCHSTGRVRGLLCGRCNWSIERFEKFAAEMAKYLSC
jgi:hypothetical protein